MSWLRRPKAWSVLLTVAGALLFVRLGIWQLHRADYKVELLQRYAAAADAAPQDFDAVAATAPPDAYPRVRVQGRYLAARTYYLLDDPKHDERGGVEVYAPFQPRGHQRLLLVDLGFLPGNGSGKLPQVPPLPGGSVWLQGLYQPPPGHGFEMGGDALARQAHWPKSTIYLDMHQVAADLRRRFYPRMLALDPDPASGYVRRHVLDLGMMTPARHRAYAFQWFCFAVVAVVMFLVLHRKQRPSQRGDRR